MLIATYLPAIVTIFTLLLLSTYAHPFAKWGAGGWVLLFVAHFTTLMLGETRGIPRSNGFTPAPCWALALIIAWEASWQIANVTTGVWAQLPWGVVPALVIAWLSRRSCSHAGHLPPMSGVSHFLLCAAGDCHRAMGRGDQSRQHRRLDVVAVPAVAQSARCQRGAVFRVTGDVVEPARRTAAVGVAGRFACAAGDRRGWCSCGSTPR